MVIQRLTAENKSDLNIPNEPFDVIGRLEIHFDGGEWHSEEVLSAAKAEKQYPNYDGAGTDDYINADDRAAYLVYDGEKCIGQILLALTWNRYAHIEDISVAVAYRGQGIGTKLLEKAAEWAKEKKLLALSLECQDNNILASRFYMKNGFKIGGMNTRLYSMLGEPYSSEKAVFWYKEL